MVWRIRYSFLLFILRSLESAFFLYFCNSIISTKSSWSYQNVTSGYAVSWSIRDLSGSASVLWNRFKELSVNLSLLNNSMSHTAKRTVKVLNGCGTSGSLSCSEPLTNLIITLLFAMTMPLALTTSIVWQSYTWTNGWRMMKSPALATSPENTSTGLHHSTQTIPTDFNHNLSWTIYNTCWNWK